MAFDFHAGLFQPLRHVREDRDAGGAAGALARIYTYVGPHRADDDAAAALLREVLQVGGHLGDVDVVVVESRYPPCFYKWTLSQLTLSHRRRKGSRYC